MLISVDHERTALAAEVLNESYVWSLGTFFDGVGSAGPDELHEGTPGRTLHSSGGDVASKCQVWLPITADSAATNLPDIAAHEGFHVAAGANVYHWTHEALACLAATLSHTRLDNGGSTTLSRRELGEARIGEADLFSRFCTARAMRLETVPHQDLSNMTPFYSRARVVGSALNDICGLTALGHLARAVREVRCDMLPHPHHEGCPMDGAVTEWVSDLAPGERDRVRDLLELDR